MPHQWVIDVEKDLGKGRLVGHDGGPVSMPAICRVPAKVRERNEKAYQPEVMSIGPYHHGEERLQAMEKHKRRALLHFLNRSMQTPREYVDLLRGSLPEITAAYDNLHRKWKAYHQELFLELMLMDGCFIIEILVTSAGVVDDYDKDDPIFGRHGRLYYAPSIRRDLLLMENQIPFLVLQKLFSGVKIKGYKDRNGLIRCLSEFLLEYPGTGLDLSPYQSLHILDLYRQIFISGENSAGGEERDQYYNLKKFSTPKIPSAMELQDHGIILHKERQPVIKFSRRRLLWKLLSADFRSWMLNLPELTVDDTTKSVFLNAMFFESLCPAADAKFTSYVYLMSNLMVSVKDAGLLSTELGIIRNELRSDKALVELFQRLSSENFVHDYQLFLLQMTINKYCRGRWNRFRAYVNRTYFRNPWTQLSIFSGVVLFVLTAIQAFYTVYPNYTNKHKP